MNIVVFDSITGEILRGVDCPESMAAMQCGSGESYVEGVGRDDTHFIDTEVGELRLKQPLNLSQPAPITANGTDEAVITGVPGGVFVTWPDGEREEVTDGAIEFSVTQPGSYSLKFDGVKYLTEVVTIEANPQA